MQQQSHEVREGASQKIALPELHLVQNFSGLVDLSKKKHLNEVPIIDTHVVLWMKVLILIYKGILKNIIKDFKDIAHNCGGCRAVWAMSKVLMCLVILAGGPQKKMIK